MKVAIIPARIGSKRIPKKNIKNFCGKPIIFWAIKAIKKTKIFDKIIVSTDSKKIASMVKKYNVEAPFLRPALLSNDQTSLFKVMVHAIKWLIKNNHDPSFVCCIYPTAAFVKPSDILKGYRMIKKGKWHFVFAATSFDSVLRAFQKNSKKGLKMLFPKNFYKRTQDLRKVYYDAGQFCWGKKNSWLRSEPVFSKNSSIVYIPKWRAHDINTMEDWNVAEKFAKLNNLLKL